MERDLAARQDLHDNAPGVADISVATIRNYHADVFDEFGLPPETWTAFAPTMVAGPDGEDELWARILENAASGPDSLWVDAVIFAMMYDAAEDPENPHVVLAAQWVINISRAVPEAFGIDEPDVGPYQVSSPGGGYVIGGTTDGEEIIGSDKADAGN